MSMTVQDDCQQSWLYNTGCIGQTLKILELQCTKVQWTAGQKWQNIFRKYNKKPLRRVQNEIIFRTARKVCCFWTLPV